MRYQKVLSLVTAVSTLMMAGLSFTPTAQAISDCRRDGSGTVEVCLSARPSSYTDKGREYTRVANWKIQARKLDRRGNVTLKRLEVAFGCGGFHRPGKGKATYRSSQRRFQNPAAGRTYTVSLVQCNQYLQMTPGPGYQAATAKLWFTRGSKRYGPVQLTVTAGGQIPNAGYLGDR